MSVRDFPSPPPIDSPDFHEWLEKVRLRLCIDDLLSLTTPALGDEFALFDISADATRKVTLTNLKSLIVTGGITLNTVVATTSGTTKDVTGIQTGAKRIVGLLNGVSTNGATNILIRLGDAGGIEATGYLGACSTFDGTTYLAPNSTTGFLITATVAVSTTFRGYVVLSLEDSTNFTWVYASIIHDSLNNLHIGSGRKSLSQELSQFRLTSVTPDTFDAGEFNSTVES